MGIQGPPPRSGEGGAVGRAGRGDLPAEVGNGRGGDACALGGHRVQSHSVPVRGLANLGHEPCSEAIPHNLPSTGKNWESLHSLVEYDYLRFQFSESECVFLMRYLLKIARWSSV